MKAPQLMFLALVRQAKSSPVTLLHVLLPPSPVLWSAIQSHDLVQRFLGDRLLPLELVSTASEPLRGRRGRLSLILCAECFPLHPSLGRSLHRKERWLIFPLQRAGTTSVNGGLT